MNNQEHVDPEPTQEQKSCDHSWWVVYTCPSHWVQQCWNCRIKERIEKD